MNTRLDFIFTRRSVRKYLDKDIPARCCTTCSRPAWRRHRPAADPCISSSSPKGGTRRDRHGPAVRQDAALRPGGDRGLRRSGAGPGWLEPNLVQDGSAAVENILLAATALGLGSCWLGRLSPSGPYRRPAHPVATAAPNRAGGRHRLGWPAVVPEARTRYRPERIHWERWQ